jgi:site-specific recombinase XerD
LEFELLSRPQVSLQIACDRFLQHGGFTDAERESLGVSLRRFRSFLGDELHPRHEPPTLSHFNADTVERFHISLIDKGRAGRTQHRHLEALKQFSAWLRSVGIRAYDDLADYQLPDPTEPARDWHTIGG